MHKKIAVVIPFYQKEKGILTKAVESALRQKAITDVEIIVVDDASPVPAREELATIVENHPSRIVLVEQQNSGPAGARNRGLNHVSAETEYVAFLDSDDEWIDTHLLNAVSALDKGYDFYFSDLYQLNQTVSAFSRAKRIQPEAHPRIAGLEGIHEYRGDMFNQVLTGNVIGTPTVVYRFRKFPSLRFREEFVYAGEDYLFWLELSKLTDKIAFSAICECTCGAGVNIFSGSGWGTEKSLIRIHHEMKYKKVLGRLFSLSRAQADSTNRAISTLRKSFVADVLHRLAHGKAVEFSILKNQFKVDPKTLFYFLPIAVLLASRRESRE